MLHTLPRVETVLLKVHCFVTVLVREDHLAETVTMTSTSSAGARKASDDSCESSEARMTLTSSPPPKQKPSAFESPRKKIKSTAIVTPVKNAIEATPKEKKNQDERIEIHEGYNGCVIFATPGAGKSHIVERALSSATTVIDADSILLDTLAEEHPDYEFDRSETHCGPIVHSFGKRYGFKTLFRLYPIAAEKLKKASATGAVIFTGNTRFMHLANYVFVQTDPYYIREGYPQSKELQTAQKLGKKTIPLTGYLSRIISNDPMETLK